MNPLHDDTDMPPSEVMSHINYFRNTCNRELVDLGRLDRDVVIRQMGKPPAAAEPDTNAEDAAFQYSSPSHSRRSTPSPRTSVIGVREQQQQQYSPAQSRLGGKMGSRPPSTVPEPTPFAMAMFADFMRNDTQGVDGDDMVNVEALQQHDQEHVQEEEGQEHHQQQGFDFGDVDALAKSVMDDFDKNFDKEFQRKYGLGRTPPMSASKSGNYHADDADNLYQQQGDGSERAFQDLMGVFGDTLGGHDERDDADGGDGGDPLSMSNVVINRVQSPVAVGSGSAPTLTGARSRSRSPAGAAPSAFPAGFRTPTRGSPLSNPASPAVRNVLGGGSSPAADNSKRFRFNQASVSGDRPRETFAELLARKKREMNVKEDAEPSPRVAVPSMATAEPSSARRQQQQQQQQQQRSSHQPVQYRRHVVEDPAKAEQSFIRENEDRRYWLGQIRTLLDFKVPLSKLTWSMSDTAYSMQHEVTRAYERMEMLENVQTWSKRIKLTGTMVHWSNCLLRLNLPLGNYQDAMINFSKKPLTKFHIQQLVLLTSRSQSVHPAWYLVTNMAWPLMQAVFLKLFSWFFGRYIGEMETANFLRMISDLIAQFDTDSDVDISNKFPGIGSGAGFGSTPATNTFVGPSAPSARSQSQRQRRPKVSKTIGQDEQQEQGNVFSNIFGTITNIADTFLNSQGKNTSAAAPSTTATTTTRSTPSRTRTKTPPKAKATSPPQQAPLQDGIDPNAPAPEDDE